MEIALNRTIQAEWKPTTTKNQNKQNGSKQKTQTKTNGRLLSLFLISLGFVTAHCFNLMQCVIWLPSSICLPVLVFQLPYVGSNWACERARQANSRTNDLNPDRTKNRANSFSSKAFYPINLFEFSLMFNMSCALYECTVSNEISCCLNVVIKNTGGGKT